MGNNFRQMFTSKPEPEPTWQQNVDLTPPPFIRPLVPSGTEVTMFIQDDSPIWKESFRCMNTMINMQNSQFDQSFNKPTCPSFVSIYDAPEDCLTLYETEEDMHTNFFARYPTVQDSWTQSQRAVSMHI